MWSYSGDPAASDRDELRFLIGDTDSTHPQLSNAEVDYQLGEYSSVALAAAACADSIAAKYARLCSKSVGDLNISYGERRDNYSKLAAHLRIKAARVMLPKAGGLSIADKESVEADADRVAPAFKVDMHEAQALEAAAEQD